MEILEVAHGAGCPAYRRGGWTIRASSGECLGLRAVWSSKNWERRGVRAPFKPKASLQARFGMVNRDSRGVRVELLWASGDHMK